MDYKQYTIHAFESAPGKWRASVRRTDGKLLWKGRAKIRSFVTGIDAKTLESAMRMAIAAIAEALSLANHWLRRNAVRTTRQVAANVARLPGSQDEPGRRSAAKMLSEDEGRWTAPTQYKSSTTKFGTSIIIISPATASTKAFVAS